LSLILDRRAPYRREAKWFTREHGGLTGTWLPERSLQRRPGSFIENTTAIGTPATIALKLPDEDAPKEIPKKLDHHSCSSQDGTFM
jgi:hypothetical protein